MYLLDVSLLRKCVPKTRASTKRGFKHGTQKVMTVTEESHRGAPWNCLSSKLTWADAGPWDGDFQNTRGTSVE